MTVLTEKFHAGGFIVSEANGLRSRDVGILHGSDLVAGQVLGKIGVSTGAPTYAAGSGNTGTFTCGTVTESAGAKVGVYRIEFIAATVFLVADPDGAAVGEGNLGTAFSKGGIGFTLTAGATAAVVGDDATITVAANANVGKYTVYAPAATDGTQTAAAILFDDAAAADTDVRQTIVVRDAEVNAGELVWPSAITADQKTAALADLAEIGIIAR